MSYATTRKSVAALALALALAAAASAQSPHPSFDVQVTGTGPAIVLIPGLLSTGEVWETTVARYKDRYTLHVLTLAGFGGPAPIGAPFLSRVRDELIRYLEGVQGLQGERGVRVDKPILVGHSLGGFLAFWVAATAPDLVGGVVAVDGVPFLPALVNPAATAEGAAIQGEQIRTMYAGVHHRPARQPEPHGALHDDHGADGRRARARLGPSFGPGHCRYRRGGVDVDRSPADDRGDHRSGAAHRRLGRRSGGDAAGISKCL